MTDPTPVEQVALHLTRCLRNSPKTMYLRLTREEVRLLIEAVTGEQVP